MEYVLYDIPNRVRKIKDVSSGLVKTKDVSADLLAQTEKSMISDLGMVPFKDTKNLTEGAHYIQLYFINVSQIYNATGTLDSSYFWVDHIINITSITQFYVDDTSQIVAMEIHANTSYQGNSGRQSG